MFKIKFDLPFKIKKADINPETGQVWKPLELFRALLIEAVQSVYITQGPRSPISNMTRKEGRIWGKIDEKINEAEDEGKLEIELSDEQFDFIREKLVLNDAVKIHPSLYMNFNVISDYFLEYGKGEKK